MKYYCIGIKGAGMSTLACCLKDLGYEVVGYDDYQGYKFSEEGLIKRNIKINYQPTNIDKDYIVTYSKAFSNNHPEIIRMINNGNIIQNYNEIIGDITKRFETVGVNGTHGKTTVTMMISKILESNYFIGDGSGKIDVNNNLFVLESDEYNKHFLAYFPKISVTNNIEEDHLECYPKGIDEIIDTYTIFNNKAEFSIVNGDDLNVAKMDIKHPIIKYGISDNLDVVAKNYVLDSQGIRFDCFYKNKFIYHFNFEMYGMHSLYNVLAAISVGLFYGVEPELIQKKLSNFNGAKRRFKIETFNNNIIVDDYAHHPSEIKTTLSAVKQKYPSKKIVSIFMPNTYSRTIDLFQDFTLAFKDSDEVYLTDIKSDREYAKDFNDFKIETLIKEINGCKKLDFDNIEILNHYENSVLVFMSCANITPYIEKYKEKNRL